MPTDAEPRHHKHGFIHRLRVLGLGACKIPFHTHYFEVSALRLGKQVAERRRSRDEGISFPYTVFFPCF
jgi:hypothetical protein